IAREEPVAAAHLLVELGDITLAVRKVMCQIAVVVVGAGGAIKPGGIGKLIRVLGQEFDRNRVKAALWDLVPGKRRRGPTGRTGTARRQSAGYALGVIDGIPQPSEREVPVQHGLVRGRRGRDIGLVIIIQPVREEEKGLVSPVVNLRNNYRAAENSVEVVVLE